MTAEIFDLTAGASMGVCPVAADVLSPTSGFAGDTAFVVWSPLGGSRAETNVVTWSTTSGVLNGPMETGGQPIGGQPSSATVCAAMSGMWVQAYGLGTLSVITTDGTLRTQIVFPDSLGAARPFPTMVFPLNPEQLLVVNPGLPAAAVVEPLTSIIDVSKELASHQGYGSGTLSPWTADTDGTYLYVADTSGAQGGIWVYEVPALELVDRWLSTTPFAAVQASADGLFALARDQALLFVLNADGAIQSATELSAPPLTLV
ncbi:MAG: hypothetical protein M0T77_15095 [Actinomycetota bacterium]|nr:hypothetical protein [Actinomycetota bacterium]